MTVASCPLPLLPLWAVVLEQFQMSFFTLPLPPQRGWGYVLFKMYINIFVPFFCYNILYLALSMDIQVHDENQGSFYEKNLLFSPSLIACPGNDQRHSCLEGFFLAGWWGHFWVYILKDVHIRLLWWWWWLFWSFTLNWFFFGLDLQIRSVVQRLRSRGVINLFSLPLQPVHDCMRILEDLVFVFCV